MRARKVYKISDRMWAFLLIAYLDVAILGGVALIAHFVEARASVRKSIVNSCFDTTHSGTYCDNEPPFDITKSSERDTDRFSVRLGGDRGD
jgi:hypothetical protein